MRKSAYIILALIAATLIAASATTRSAKRDIGNNLTIFNRLFKELQTYYVDSIDAKKSVETAIAAMLDDIDPYTVYIPYEEQADFRSMTTGEYGGVGSFIMERNGNVYFSEPAEGSPSQLAGIRAGDMILMINGDSVAGWKSSKVSETLKGTPGTDVRVTVNRPWIEDSILTFDITRRKIQMPSVPYYGMLADGHTGYIQLTSFTEKSADEVRSALVDLMARPGFEALVLDLRGNGGGLVESAVKIVGLFTPKGTEVLRTRGKDVMSEKIYKTSSKPLTTDLPLIVLIDGGTASASEIVAGSLQDMDRAVIIGTRSFGKGLVQTTRPLPYDGMLKVTIAKYYIPSGRLIQAIDYSHRNPDGSVSRIPDSLTSVFHTRAGREVRDGGGITPDITIDYPDITRLTYNLVRDNWVFDYATRYAATHPSLPAPGEFVVTDSIYADFKSTIDPSRLNYDKVCETILKQLRESARSEGYMNDSVQATLDLLERQLHHDLDHDLDVNRKIIEPYLAGEIVSRYYFARGEAEHALRYDNALDTVFALTASPQKYRAILKSPADK